MIKSLKNYNYTLSFTKSGSKNFTIDVFIKEKRLWKTTLKSFLQILIQEGCTFSYSEYYTGVRFRYTFFLTSKINSYD